MAGASSYLDAAEHGIHGVSPAEVSKIVGVSTCTFHNYFPTREDAVAHHMSKVLASWPDNIAEAPADWDIIKVLVETTESNIQGDSEDDFTYADVLILSVTLSNLGNMKPHDFVIAGLRGAAEALSKRAGLYEIPDEHLVMVHFAWEAVHGAVLGAHGADDPESAFMPLFRAAITTVERVLREGLFEFPEGV